MGTQQNEWIHQEISGSFGCSEVVANHCIIYLENLCSKVLGFAEFKKYLVQSVNYIRSWGLNHRQLMVFLLKIEADCADVVDFSAVCWLFRAATLKRF